MIAGGAAAVLAGLLFVAVNLHIDKVARSRDSQNRAAQGLYLFGIVLFVSALISIPGQTYGIFGVELIVLALISLIFMITLWRKFTNSIAVTSLVLLAAGIVLVVGVRAGMYVLVATMLTALAFGTRVAWLLLLSFMN